MTMAEPCKQCGMRIRKNETWHDERHYYSQDLGMIVIIRREPNEDKRA